MVKKLGLNKRPWKLRRSWVLHQGGRQTQPFGVWTSQPGTTFSQLSLFNHLLQLAFESCPWGIMKNLVLIQADPLFAVVYFKERNHCPPKGLVFPAHLTSLLQGLIFIDSRSPGSCVFPSETWAVIKGAFIPAHLPAAALEPGLPRTDGGSSQVPGDSFSLDKSDCPVVALCKDGRGPGIAFQTAGRHEGGLG